MRFTTECVGPLVDLEWRLIVGGTGAGGMTSVGGQALVMDQILGSVL